MTIKEIIKNLLDQAEDRESCADPDDPEDIFRLDARALREAAGLLSNPSGEFIPGVIDRPTKEYPLLPCPFCGNEEIVYEKYQTKVGERWRCWCTNCMAGIERGYDVVPGTVREAWNQRAGGGTEPPDGPLTLEQLRGMDGEPVWVVGLSSINDFKGHWDILVMEGENNELAVFPRCLEYGWFKDYGITWTAYRRRTMGDLKGADSNEQNCG